MKEFEFVQACRAELKLTSNVSDFDYAISQWTTIVSQDIYPSTDNYLQRFCRWTAAGHVCVFVDGTFNITHLEFSSGERVERNSA